MRIKCVLKKRFCRFKSIKPECTMDLFRCSGISISRIFPCSNELLTQPTPTRHLGSMASFRDILAPKLLGVKGNIKKC